MGRWDNKRNCSECGIEFRQRFLGMPTVWCSSCAARHTPVEQWGCLLVIPAVAVAVPLFGVIGFYVGKLLAQFFPIPNFAGVVAFIAGTDAFGVTFIFFLRPMMNVKADTVSGIRLGALAAFAYVAARCAQGMGIYVLMLSAALNALLMLPLVIYLIPIPNSQTN